MIPTVKKLTRPMFFAHIMQPCVAQMIKVHEMQKVLNVCVAALAYCELLFFKKTKYSQIIIIMPNNMHHMENSNTSDSLYKDLLKLVKVPQSTRCHFYEYLNPLDPKCSTSFTIIVKLKSFFCFDQIIFEDYLFNVISDSFKSVPYFKINPVT